MDQLPAPPSLLSSPSDFFNRESSHTHHTTLQTVVGTLTQSGKGTVGEVNSYQSCSGKESVLL